jgi:hypothetical protein
VVEDMRHAPKPADPLSNVLEIPPEVLLKNPEFLYGDGDV